MTVGTLCNAFCCYCYQGKKREEEEGGKSRRRNCCITTTIIVIMSKILVVIFLLVILKTFGNEIDNNSVDDNIWDDRDEQIISALNGTDEEEQDNTKCSNSSLTQFQRDMILSTHNELRRSLAFGNEPNKEGYMSSARNMYKLEWDCELENMAANYSASCPNTFIPQNILRSRSHLFKRFYFYWDQKDSTNHIKKAMKTWWKQGQEKGNFDSKNRFFARNQYFAWANMAKAKTYKIGCSYVLCPDDQSAMFVCLYNEKAQCELEMIYEPGTPCTNDTDCFTYPGSKCILSEGLCQAPNLPKDRETQEMCKVRENTRMTDETRIWALEQHNFYRSRLARGYEFNGETNCTQAKASKMLKMEYDCVLEEFAQNWADNCVFGHSTNDERPNQGQNLYMSSFINLDARSLIHTATEKWWQELEEYGLPENNILSADLWDEKGKAIGHYTQMAWDKTYRLGCGIGYCQHMTYVVCHYGPAGNRKNQKIYEVGEPCNCDRDCPIGTTCEFDTSLCQIRRK
ncbi:unnamed protein product [Caenorhabditis angaria]|uniref:SCP domain-containing protein n=1 Tax=Caenorhabditis angaria TaxID=860376 RepID=A0A9P1J2H3_9PELO|nr:unnamed protein product [Caenorhabditis angaria]